MPRSIVILAFALLLRSSALLARGPKYNEGMSISFSAPDIRAYVTDRANAKSGVDPTLTLNAVGLQWSGNTLRSMEHVPRSYVTQNNEDNIGDTLWEVYVGDPMGTYVFNYSSDKTAAFGDMGITFYSYSPRLYEDTDIILIGRKGVYKKVAINVDQQMGLTVTPQIDPGDFLKDVQSVCDLGAIGPSEACGALGELAAEVEKARAAGRAEAEKAGLKVFLAVLDRLHDWNHHGSRQDWDDFKDAPECDRLRGRRSGGVGFSVQDFAYSALKLDVETLLRGLVHAGLSLHHGAAKR